MIVVYYAMSWFDRLYRLCAIRMSGYLVPVYKPSGPEPSRKGELFYTKKPDPVTANLIKSMRKNEAMLRLKVGSET